MVGLWSKLRWIWFGNWSSRKKEWALLFAQAQQRILSSFRIHASFWSSEYPQILFPCPLDDYLKLLRLEIISAPYLKASSLLLKPVNWKNALKERGKKALKMGSRSRTRICRWNVWLLCGKAIYLCGILKGNWSNWNYSLEVPNFWEDPLLAFLAAISPSILLCS